MRSRGPRLGEILERQGALGREQLLRALRNQKVVGGRLGTCLLEIDALSEDALLRALSEQQGVSFATQDDLRGIEDEILELVPAKVCKSNLAIPFRASGSRIQVAMVDARDLRALDELAFVTGRKVEPHVTSEARLLEALEKYFGEEVPQRFGKLLDRLNRARFLWTKHEEKPRPEELQWDPGVGVRASAGSAAGVRAPAAAAPPAARSTAAPAPTAGTPAPAAPERAAAAPAPAAKSAPETAARPATVAAPAGPPPRPEGPVPLEETEKRLLAPRDADDVGRALIEFSRGRAEHGVLFQIRRAIAVGWFAQGPASKTLEGLKVVLDRPSLFVALRDGAAIHRGPLTELVAHQSLRETLGPAADRDLLALPLNVRNRLVAVLLVTPKRTFDQKTIADLQHAVAKASIALELCIMRKKLKKA